MTLGRVSREARLPQLPQHRPQLTDVDVPTGTVDDDVIYVGRCVGLVGSQELVHHALEGGLNAGLLVVPMVSKSRTGARAFSYQDPLQWNQLPVVVREADTLSIFKSSLKTFLFDKPYS